MYFIYIFGIFLSRAACSWRPEVLTSQAIGLAKTPAQAIEVSIVNYLWPTLIVVLSVFARRTRRPNVLIVPGVLIATAGVASVVGGDAGLSFSSIAEKNVSSWPVPYALALMDAIAWSCYSVFSPGLSKGQDGLTLFFTAVAACMWALYFAAGCPALPGGGVSFGRARASRFGGRHRRRLFVLERRDREGRHGRVIHRIVRHAGSFERGEPGFAGAGSRHDVLGGRRSRRGRRAFVLVLHLGGFDILRGAMRGRKPGRRGAVGRAKDIVYHLVTVGRRPRAARWADAAALRRRFAVTSGARGCTRKGSGRSWRNCRFAMSSC